MNIFEESIRHPRPVYVDTNQKLTEALSRCKRARILAVDTETLGFKLRPHNLDDEPLYMGLCPDVEHRYFVPRTKMHYFRTILADESTLKVLHNYKFDHHRLVNVNTPIGGTIVDTAALDALLYAEQSHRLDYLSMKYFKVPMIKYSDATGGDDPRRIKPGHPNWEKFLCYGTLDALMTLRLFFYLEKKLEKLKLSDESPRSLLDYYYQYDEKQIKVLFAMERHGIRVDPDLFEKWTKETLHAMEESKKLFCKSTGKIVPDKFFRSSKELSTYLYKDLGLPILKKTDSGAPATDSKTLKELYAKHPDLAGLSALMAFKSEATKYSTFCKGYGEHIRKGRMHTSYNPIDVRTGRLSSSKPNLQNPPPWVREAFIPDEGCVLLAADYTALELRILAHMSNDEKLIEGFLSGKDMHCFSASMMAGVSYEEFVDLYKGGDTWAKEMREASKAITYGLVYGQAAFSTARALTSKLGREVPVEEAEGYIEKYFNSFPRVKPTLEGLKSSARDRGYARTLCGKRRPTPGINSGRWKERSMWERVALNTPFQGSAADITKCAMIRCHNSPELKELGVKVVLQVHDELVFNCPIDVVEEAAPLIVQLMEDPFNGTKLRIPLTVSYKYGNNWMEIK
tara:strand:- start:6621 stop:8498 length:1878 start_codon:yes stop_codon:yes gene_type:complete